MALNTIYYAYRQSVKDGKIDTVNKTGTKADMEYQYCLFRASSAKNEKGNDLDVCEWGSLQGGQYERKIYEKETPQNNAASE